MTHFHLSDMSLPEQEYDDEWEATCHECGETFPMRRAMLG